MNKYTLTETNLNDLISWLRGGHVNRVAAALENLKPTAEAVQVEPELDRLRASNAELTEEIYQLRASRAELLVALQKISFEGDYSSPEGMKRIARAAIAKTTGSAS